MTAFFVMYIEHCPTFDDVIVQSHDILMERSMTMSGTITKTIPHDKKQRGKTTPTSQQRFSKIEKLINSLRRNRRQVHSY